MPPVLTARQLVKYVADLHGVADDDAVARSLDTVGLLDVADRRVGGFSKGMRQRTKVAAALVTDPQVLVLDEPLNGADPVQRAHLITLFRSLGQQGRTVIVSSHVLHEVERLAERQIALVRGRLAAAGGHRDRGAMADRLRPCPRPHTNPRARGASARGEQHQHRRVKPRGCLQPRSRRGDRAPQLARSLGARLDEVRPLDDSLEACSGSWSRERPPPLSVTRCGFRSPEAMVDARVALRRCRPPRLLSLTSDAPPGRVPPHRRRRPVALLIPTGCSRDRRRRAVTPRSGRYLHFTWLTPVPCPARSCSPAGSAGGSSLS